MILRRGCYWIFGDAIWLFCVS